MLKLSIPTSSGPSAATRLVKSFESAFPDVTHAVRLAANAVEHSG
ncbi:MAG: hypothetical protein QMC36_09190 [Patescibacteria group bacterium]